MLKKHLLLCSLEEAKQHVWQDLMVKQMMNAFLFLDELIFSYSLVLGFSMSLVLVVSSGELCSFVAGAAGQ